MVTLASVCLEVFVEEVLVLRVVTRVRGGLESGSWVWVWQRAGSLLPELLSDAVHVESAQVGVLVRAIASVRLLPVVFELLLLALLHFDPVDQYLGRVHS